MELTSEQTKILVYAIKSFRSAKAQNEQTAKNVVAKLDKVKEACQGTGSEQQVMATANELLANSYINMPERMD